MSFNSLNGRFSEKSLGRILTGVVFLYQVLAAVVLIWALILSVRWVEEPFVGTFYEHTLVFTVTGPVTGVWAFNDIVNSGDQLLAVNGVKVENSRDVRNAITGSFVPGENVTLTSLQGRGETRSKCGVAAIPRGWRQRLPAPPDHHQFDLSHAQYLDLWPGAADSNLGNFNIAASSLPFRPDYQDGVRDFMNGYLNLGPIRYRFTCSTCHDPHGTSLQNLSNQDPGYPDLRLPKSNPDTLCHECHR